MQPVLAPILFVILFLGLSLAGAYPFHPISFTGWLLWIGLGVPLWVVMEHFFGKITSDRISNKIDPRPTMISGLRILFGVMILLLFFGVALAVSSLTQHGFGEFIDQYSSNER